MLSAQTTSSEWLEKRMEHSRALCAVSSGWRHRMSEARARGQCRLRLDYS